MRKALHQITVFKRTGLAFVCIANEVTRHTFGSGNETPFHSRWKSCPTSSTQTAFLYFFSYFFRFFLQRRFKSRIAPFLTVYLKSMYAGNRNFIKQQLFSHNQALIISFFQWVTLS